jgi:fatty acid desaturase
MVLMALLLLLTDFTLYVFMNRWLISTVLVYFIIEMMRPKDEQKKIALYSLFIALLLEDCVQFGRFGLVIVAIAPIFIFSNSVKHNLLHGTWILTFLGVVIFYLFENIMIYRFIYGLDQDFFVTIIKIFTNLIVGYSVLLGMRDNRLLSVFTHKGRKVWTPNRKSAS